MPRLSVSIRVHDLRGEEYELRGEWPLPDDTSIAEADFLSKDIFTPALVEMCKVQVAVEHGWKPAAYERLARILKALTPEQREAYLLAAQNIAKG